MATKRHWHVFGRMNDELSFLVTVGPSPELAPALEEINVGVPVAYLGSQDHDLTEAERDAYVKQMESHS